MTTIRPATGDDARAIAHAQVETWRSAYRGIVADEFLDTFSEDNLTGRWTEIVQHPDQITFVAEIEGYGVVGFANGGPEGKVEKISRMAREGNRAASGCHVRPLADRLRLQHDVNLGLGDNPFRLFYERLGETLIDEGEIEIGEQKHSGRRTPRK